jgi:hypothetical protein
MQFGNVSRLSPPNTEENRGAVGRTLPRLNGEKLACTRAPQLSVARVAAAPALDRDQAARAGGAVYFVDDCGAAGLVKAIPFAVISDSSRATVSGNGSREA